MFKRDNDLNEKLNDITTGFTGIVRKESAAERDGSEQPMGPLERSDSDRVPWQTTFLKPHCRRWVLTMTYQMLQSLR